MVFAAAGCSTGGFDGGSEASSGPPSAAPAPALAALAGAAPDADERFTNSHVGRIEGSDALIGVTIDQTGSQVTVYVCDGDPADLASQAALGSWVRGPVAADGSFDLTNGDVHVVGTWAETDASFNGTVTLPDGTVHQYVATQAIAPAGLYSEQVALDDGSTYNVGWLQASDGQVVGAALWTVIVVTDHVRFGFEGGTTAL
jgi:hypothetical protein